MHIIVFAWPSRTGKTTTIQTLAQRFSEEGMRVCVFEETAQKYLDQYKGEQIDRYAMQRYIADQEMARINDLQSIKNAGQYDIVLVDRTIADMFVYIYWAIIHGWITNGDVLSNVDKELEISKNIYDTIIYFDKMLIEDKAFADYNNPKLNAIFSATLLQIYGSKIQSYTSKLEFEKDIDIFIKKYIE